MHRKDCTFSGKGQGDGSTHATCGAGHQPPGLPANSVFIFSRTLWLKYYSGLLETSSLMGTIKWLGAS